MESDNGRPEPNQSLLAFFGRHLKKQRELRGWSQEESARRAFTTGAMISYLENAKRVPTKDLAADLDRTFGTDFFSEFYPLVVRYAYPSWFLPYVEMEREATSVRTFESQIIPALLQTEDYARAMLTPERLDNLDGLVAARMTRQDVFGRELPPYTWFIIDEQALRRKLGGPAVMRAQLARLLVAGRHPRTVIQVLPEEVAAHPGLAGPFTLLSFDHGADVLYVDAFLQGRTALDAAEVTAGLRAYDLLNSYALSPDASADRIRQHLKGLPA